MGKVLEAQLKVEKQREAELDLVYREEARRMWEQREEEWRKERLAREKLMMEVGDEILCCSLTLSRLSTQKLELFEVFYESRQKTYVHEVFHAA